jgi:HD-GYP domain-containing protein (c-di-GMP phosphodiesterase class II)
VGVPLWFHVYQALVQDRPYRASLPEEALRKILDDFVAQKHLDGDLVALLLAEPAARELARGCETQRFGV